MGMFLESVLGLPSAYVIQPAGQYRRHTGFPPQTSQCLLITGTGTSGMPTRCTRIRAFMGSNLFSFAIEQASSHSLHPVHNAGLTVRNFFIHCLVVVSLVSALFAVFLSKTGKNILWLHNVYFKNTGNFSCTLHTPLIPQSGISDTGGFY